MTIQTSYYRNKLRFDFSKEEVEALQIFVALTLRTLGALGENHKTKEGLRAEEFFKRIESKMQKFLNDMEKAR